MPTLTTAEKYEPPTTLKADLKPSSKPSPDKPASWLAFSKRTQTVIAVGTFVLVAAIYLLRLNPIVGVFVDDAWYVLLAKALATGQGYTLINSPTAGILPLYPPGYPALLSLVYRLYPQFPENLWLLKSVSILAMLGVGVLTYIYFARLRQSPQHFAFVLSLGAMLCAPLVFLATTTTMSECVFTCSLLAAIVLLEKSVREQGAWKWVVAGAVVASFAFLTRSTALALFVAAGLYFLKHKQLRALLLFALVVLMICGPWMLYARQHAPTQQQRAEQRGNIVEAYTAQFWQRVAGDATSGEIALNELPERVWTNIQGLAGRDLGRILVAPIAEDLTREALRQRVASGDGQAFALDAGSALSFGLTGLLLLGFFFTLKQRLWLSELVVVFSLLLVFLWPFEVLRFVLPLTPFLLFYLAGSWQALATFYQRLNAQANEPRQWIGMSVVVAIFVLLNLWGVLRPLLPAAETAAKDSLNVRQNFAENQQLLRWVAERTPTESVIATQNPPLVYLFTGRKTIASDDPAARWELWKELKVNYWARTSFAPLGPASEAEQKFNIVHRVPGNLDLRIVDLGDPRTRKPW